MSAAKKKSPTPKSAPRPKATTPKLDLERVVGAAIGGFLQTLIARQSEAAAVAAPSPEQLELHGVLPQKSTAQLVDEAYQRGYTRGYEAGLHDAEPLPPSAHRETIAALHRGDVEAGAPDDVGGPVRTVDMGKVRK